MNPRLAFVFRPTILLALALMAVIVMMILPMPSWVLDVGLATSFALAILMFTVTLFIERPLEFSAFPTVLLASLIAPRAVYPASDAEDQWADPHGQMLSVFHAGSVDQRFGHSGLPSSQPATV